MKKYQKPEAWGYSTSETGELMQNGICMTELANEYGTPLHVINESRLSKTAINFVNEANRIYPGKSRVHYAFKCNSLPHVIKTVKKAGLKADVATEFELFLALESGYKVSDIIVNGPGKTDKFIKEAIEKQVGLIVFDSIEEIITANELCREAGKTIKILLRINPDYIPAGMNSGSATGSRKGSVFGLDYKGGELIDALKLLTNVEFISFQGFHLHIGTGIRDPKDYSNCLKILKDLINITSKFNFKIEVLDVGGGYASDTSREMTTAEMILYQSIGRLPTGIKDTGKFCISDFINEISKSIIEYFGNQELPLLIFEPGRSITSSNQLLLLKINCIKERPGIAKWLITDGGISTVCLPVYYEYHEVFLCNDVYRRPQEKVTITGPACFSGDIIYKNKYMPKIRKGEIIAIMDSGAYFIPMESSFGFPRSAVVTVNGNSHEIVRQREDFREMLSRDKYQYHEQLK